MEPVAEVAGRVSADEPSRRGLDVDSVAGLLDVVAEELERHCVPHVDARALLAGLLAADAADAVALEEAVRLADPVEPCVLVTAVEFAHVGAVL